MELERADFAYQTAVTVQGNLVIELDAGLLWKQNPLSAGMLSLAAAIFVGITVLRLLGIFGPLILSN